jgi:hypothetical protein
METATARTAKRIELAFTMVEALLAQPWKGIERVDQSAVKRSVCGTEPKMTPITQLQQNRRIVQDFTLTTLAGISGEYAKLAYMGSIRDLSSGRYEHAGLAALYPDEATQQALQLCHEQVFERVLETSLEGQMEDLKECLDRMPGGRCATVAHWRRLEAYRVLMPERAPGYLKELFCSNLRALLEILQEECSKVPSDA